MDSITSKKAVFACGIAISIVNSPGLSLAKVEAQNLLTSSSSCVSMNVNDFISSHLAPEQLVADLWENVIHAEQVYVCFDELGVINNIVPINQISASIENL